MDDAAPGGPLLDGVLLRRLESSRRDYLRHRRALRLLEGFVDEDDDRVDAELKEKVSRIVSDHSVSETLNLDGGLSLLGVEDAVGERLCEYEGDLLLDVVRGLREACDECCSAPEDTPTTPPSCPEEEEEELNTLLSERNLYIQNLQTLQDLLEQITDLRLNKIPSAIDRRIDHHHHQVRLNSLKAGLSLLKTEVEIFKETDISLDSYKELFKDVKEQIEGCEKDIRDLTELKRKYERASCVEYDQLLKQYKGVKDEIRKVEMMRGLLRADPSNE